MSQRREQTVIGARKIDIDQFNIARPGRNDMKIPHRQIREDDFLRGEKLALGFSLAAYTARFARPSVNENWPMKCAEAAHRSATTTPT